MESDLSKVNVVTTLPQRCVFAGSGPRSDGQSVAASLPHCQHISTDLVLMVDAGTALCYSDCMGGNLALDGFWAATGPLLAAA